LSALHSTVNPIIKPKIVIRKDELEVYIEQNDLSFTKDGLSYIKPHHGKTINIKIDKAIYEVIKHGYDKQKELLKKAQEAFVHMKDETYEFQKKVINETLTNINKAQEIAKKEGNKIDETQKKVFREIQEKAKKVIKKINPF
jgi:hypothetical protein